MSEIVFIIDPKESLANHLLALRTAEILAGKLHPFTTITQAHLKQRATNKEKEIIEFLIKEELNYQNTTHSFHLIHIRQSQTIAALKLIGDTQKLFFNEKQLVTDFFTKVDFYYKIENKNNSFEVTGRLKWRENDIDIRECDWIGRGKFAYFIRKLSLKTISTDLNWKYIPELLKGPLTLSGMQKAAFMEAIDPSDPDSPQIVLVGATQEELTKAHEPFPLLILKDKLGAFADLWMDYGNGIRLPFHENLGESHKNVKRQKESEKNWEKDLLETDFIKKFSSSSHYYCPLDKIAKTLTFLLEVGWHIEDVQGKRLINQRGSDLKIDQTNQTLQIKGKVRFDEYQVDVTDLLKAYKHGDRFYPLDINTVGLLPAQWEYADLHELAEEGEFVGDTILIKRSHLGSLSSLLKNAEKSPVLSGLEERLQDFKKLTETLPGKDFNGELRPYQQQGLNWLSFLADYQFHGILADDMGLGKTIQILALLSRLHLDKPCMIVAPTSLLFNWKNEIQRFLPNIKCLIHQGSERTESPEELQKHCLILVSYTTLRLDLSLFKSLSYKCLILDEAQVIKNAHTQIAQAVCSLQAELRLSLTGTPIENHLKELWSHFHFLIPDLFGEEEAFNTDLQAAQSDIRYLQRIKRKVAPFILRRKKEEVLKDLPERIDQTVWVEMSPSQRQIYHQFLAGYKKNILQKVEADGISKHRMEIFEAILRLRQICCHPLLISSMHESGTELSSSKFDTLLEDLETIREEGGKVLIYSQFTTLLHLLTKAAQERMWNYSYLDGTTQNREKVVSTFQDHPSVNFFFISLKAGGVGLNLTAADYVYLYDPWWNEAVEEQAISRAHRMGRKNTVIAKRFITHDSIEEKMMTLKANKRKLLTDVFDNEEQALNLTVEDLYSLLS